MSGFELPRRIAKQKKFYSTLAGKKIRDKEYKCVLKVWDGFEMKTMKDYHDLYLKSDVVL